MRIEFCFDYLSPYSYLAWLQLQKLASRLNATVEPRPVLLAAILEANESKGPAEVPARRSYTFKDVVRKAELLGEPIAAPATHPFNPLVSLRATTAVIAQGKDATPLVNALFRATWVESRRVDSSDIVREEVTKAGFDGAAILEAAQTDPVKEALKSATTQCIERGGFGVPSLFVGDGHELFFGLDSFPVLERFLSGKDAVTSEIAARWAQVRPSATRKFSPVVQNPQG